MERSLIHVEYKSDNKNDNGWLTDKIIKDGQILRNLYNDSKNNSNEYNVATYKNLKRQHKINIKIAKQTYYNNKINNAQNRSRETWKIVNQRLGKTNYLRKPIQLTIDNNNNNNNNNIVYLTVNITTIQYVLTL